jgi:hypothetical protein
MIWLHAAMHHQQACIGWLRMASSYIIEERKQPRNSRWTCRDKSRGKGACTPLDKPVPGGRTQAQHDPKHNQTCKKTDRLLPRHMPRHMNRHERISGQPTLSGGSCPTSACPCPSSCSSSCTRSGTTRRCNAAVGASLHCGWRHRPETRVAWSQCGT